MISVLEQLNGLGWFNVVLVIALIIVLIPIALKSWKEFKSSLGLKSVNEIEEERLEDIISSMQLQISEFKENRIHDREQSFDIQRGLLDSISSINKSLEEIKADALEEKIERIRWRILDFASNLRNEHITGIEQFDYILKTCDDYENLLNKHKLKNGQVTESIIFIKEKYREILSN